MRGKCKSRRRRDGTDSRASPAAQVKFTSNIKAHTCRHSGKRSDTGLSTRARGAGHGYEVQCTLLDQDTRLTYADALPPTSQPR
jgi:hypothetical protein